MVPSHTSIVRLAKPQCVFGTCTTIGQSVDDDIDGRLLIIPLVFPYIFSVVVRILSVFIPTKKGLVYL
uniref:Uncharacterized protein n=1 Tax=Glossina palpalis gambiensis TaxID=67801 RepID=A0A1B0C0I3_9MUSC